MPIPTLTRLYLSCIHCRQFYTREAPCECRRDDLSDLSDSLKRLSMNLRRLAWMENVLLLVVLLSCFFWGVWYGLR